MEEKSEYEKELEASDMREQINKIGKHTKIRLPKGFKDLSKEDQDNIINSIKRENQIYGEE